MENTTYRIALLDDDRDEAEFLSDAVAGSGLPIELEHYKDHLHFLHSVSSSALPHLLILDVNLPLKNGMDFLNEMRSHRRLSQMPVVMYSSTYSEKYEEQSREAGAVRFLVKPTSMHDYDNLINFFYSYCASAYPDSSSYSIAS